jgi:Zn-dependent peptidase ImmA (M78 family)
MAKSLGVSSGFLSHLTQARRNFPESLAQAASEQYRVPYAFFTVSVHPSDVGPVTFRKTSKALARDENRVVRLYTEAARLFRDVSESSGYRSANLPDPVDYDRDPEQLAAEVRERAGLSPRDPVRNVIRLCERLGVGVVDNLDPEAGDESQHSGASRPSPLTDRPLIALAARLEPALKRFTVAHELYHVVADKDLEKPISSRRDPRERSADHFAGALLMSPEAAEERLSDTMTLQGYLRVKADYGLSVGALIHRAQDLEIISNDRARSLYIQWSSNGWRTNEPVSVADERPLLLGQAMSKAYGRSYAARASHVLGVPAELITRWVGVPEAATEGDVRALGLRRGH